MKIPFDQLNEIIQLYTNDRVNAARALWNSLEVEFRQAIIEFTADLFDVPTEQIMTFPASIWVSPYGEFDLSRTRLLQLMAVVPNVAKRVA